MHYTPITPFRRPVDAAHMAQLGLVNDKSSMALTCQPVNKWDLLKRLSTAKRIYGLTDRDLSVLQALLSFHPEVMLGQTGKPLVVYPSNITICQRLNGMPCSTMRRHLAKLIAAGLLVRRDSPNGKRYSRSFMGEKICFGFDLSPLLVRQEEFLQEANAVLAAEEALHRQRETLSLIRRDLFSLITFGRENGLQADWDTYHSQAVESGAHLKRRLNHTEISQLISQIETLLIEVKTILAPPVSEEMSTNARQNEHHYQKPIKELDSDQVLVTEPIAKKKVQEESISLDCVLDSLSEVQTFSSAKIRDWRSFIETVQTIRPMMGLSMASWTSAVASLGLHKAAITVAAMLERIADIQSPSAYLNKLCSDVTAKSTTISQWIMAISGRFGGAGRFSSQL